MPMAPLEVERTAMSPQSTYPRSKASPKSRKELSIPPPNTAPRTSSNQGGIIVPAVTPDFEVVNYIDTKGKQRKSKRGPSTAKKRSISSTNGRNQGKKNDEWVSNCFE